MTPTGPRYRTAVAGFTLVEALVALALTGVVLAVLTTVTAQWLPNWNRGFARVQRAELVAIAVDRVVGDISAAEFVSTDRKAKGPLFDGGALSITLVRTPVGPNSGPGLEIVRIAETADAQGSVLVRMRAAFAPGVASERAHFTDPVVLLRAPYRLSFSYAGKDGEWKGEWRHVDRLPAAVRLAVRDAANDRALAISTVAVIRVEVPADCVGGRGGDVCGKPPTPGAATQAAFADDVAPGRSRP